MSVLTSAGDAVEASQRTPSVLRATERVCTAAWRTALFPAKAAFWEPRRETARMPAAFDAPRMGAYAAGLCAWMVAMGARVAAARVFARVIGIGTRCAGLRQPGS